MPRHYHYKQGVWKPIKDPLNGQKPDVYRFDHSTVLNLVSHGVPFIIYTRRELNASFPYEIFCEFSTHPTEYYIWLVEFPDLISLLRELQVTSELSIDDLIRHANSILAGTERFVLDVNVSDQR